MRVASRIALLKLRLAEAVERWSRRVAASALAQVAEPGAVDGPVRQPPAPWAERDAPEQWLELVRRRAVGPFFGPSHAVTKPQSGARDLASENNVPPLKPRAQPAKPDWRDAATAKPPVDPRHGQERTDRKREPAAANEMRPAHPQPSPGASEAKERSAAPAEAAAVSPRSAWPLRHGARKPKAETGKPDEIGKPDPETRKPSAESAAPSLRVAAALGPERVAASPIRNVPLAAREVQARASKGATPFVPFASEAGVPARHRVAPAPRVNASEPSRAALAELDARRGELEGAERIRGLARLQAPLAPFVPVRARTEPQTAGKATRPVEPGALRISANRPSADTQRRWLISQSEPLNSDHPSRATARRDGSGSDAGVRFAPLPPTESLDVTSCWSGDSRRRRLEREQRGE